MSFGIDFASSKVTIAGAQKSDTGFEQQNISATSSATAISLRLSSNYMLFIDPFGITLGATIYVPVSASEAAVSGEFNDANTERLINGSATAADALNTSLNHTKNSFGFALTGSIFFGF